jgi:hypothetical protein
MVATAYENDRALGKRLYIHGPEGITLPDALERFFSACHPDLRVVRVKLWQARWIARLTGRMEFVSRLIAFFDRVGELGNPGPPRGALKHVERVDRESKGSAGKGPRLRILVYGAGNIGDPQRQPSAARPKRGARSRGALRGLHLVKFQIAVYILPALGARLKLV